MELVELLTRPWPWYVAGPLIGLMVPLLLILGNKAFGVSSNLQHMCAVLPSKVPFFDYDWRRRGGWNLVFFLGIVLGGFIAGSLLANPEPVAVAESTRADLAALGVEQDDELLPTGLFSWSNLLSLPGFVLMVVGGFLVGFGSRYAGGCTSGHGITGMAMLQRMSLVALVGFFVGGLVSTHLLLPLVLGG